ncbi:hypothetical protein HDU96_009901 [Phlyctochytrium bullatum]|nr:hypothetical protein HDU96_009901 [Phlyctochytrium bullatum]
MSTGNQFEDAGEAFACMVFGESLFPAKYHKVIIAIDFGTSGTGFAFAFPSLEGLDLVRDVKLNRCVSFEFQLPMIIMNLYHRPWQSSNQPFGVKTQTAVLFRVPEGTSKRQIVGDADFVAFGGEAISLVADMEPEDRGKHAFFHGFKMALYNGVGMQSQEDIVLQDDVSGVKMMAVDVIAALALDQVNGVQGGHSVHKSDVLWTVTVPAIWSHNAKNLMRRAAAKGGLIEDQKSTSLNLIWEPDAASMAFLSDEGVRMEEGETYLMVDCGGGTVDVSVHQIAEKQGYVREAVTPNGGEWGSTVIDREFERLIEEIFGEETVELCKQHHPAQWTSMMEDWEAKKCAYDGMKLKVRLPQMFVEEAFDALKEVLIALGEANIEDYNELHGTSLLLRLGNVLVLNATDFERLCHGAVESVVLLVSNQIAKAECAKLNKVVLAGHFALCQPLQKRLKQDLEPSCRVMVMENPGTAVMKGAVLLSNRPDSVMERIAARGYGVSTACRFREGLDPPSKLTIVDGRRYCLERASWLVAFGKKVPFGKVVRGRIYESNGPGIEYVDNSLCRNLGTIISKEVDPWRLRAEGVEFSMLFGATEFRVKALDPEGKSVESEISYLFD